jgi:hypothetical protein
MVYMQNASLFIDLRGAVATNYDSDHYQKLGRMFGIFVLNVTIKAMDANSSTRYSIPNTEVEQIGKIIQNYSNVTRIAIKSQHG